MVLKQTSWLQAPKWAKWLGVVLLFLHSLLCMIILIDVFKGNMETDAWWPLAFHEIDFPFSLFFLKGGLNNLIGLTIVGGIWHFSWPRILAKIYNRFNGKHSPSS